MPQTPAPSSQPTPAELAAISALVGLYATAEAVLIAAATKALRLAGLGGMGRVRRATAQVVTALQVRTPALVAEVVNTAAQAGNVDAGKALERYVHGPQEPPHGPGGTGTPPPPPDSPGGLTPAGSDGFFDLSMDHGDRAAQAIRDDLTSELQDVRFRITRLPDDIYKAIAPHGAIAQVIDNNVTLEQAQAAAWQVFTRSGVTGFTDRSGRDWALSSYVEMAVRTASARAYRESSLARMQAVGMRYFTVPPHVHPCPECQPWEGAILTAGPNLDPSVHTDGTIAEATAAGLFHPNCRHPLVGWNPLTPRPERRPWTPEDAARYRATQRQRALEVEVRKAKRAAETALTPEAAAQARKDVRAGQARIRQHLTDHPYLGRQSRREQPNLRMGTQNLTPWKPPPGPKPPFSDGSAPDWTAAIP